MLKLKELGIFQYGIAMLGVSLFMLGASLVMLGAYIRSSFFMNK